MTTTELINAYLQVWNERDLARREALMARVLTTDSVYSDPDYFELLGHRALSDAIDKLQGNIGDLHFTLGAVLGIHHDHALFTWRLGTQTTGYDLIHIAEGQIRSVIGFFA